MLSEISEYMDGLLDTDETTSSSSNEQGKITFSLLISQLINIIIMHFKL